MSDRETFKREGPCYGCPFYNDCKRRAFACERFFFWAETGTYRPDKAKLPNVFFYRLVFSEEY